ncbi:MAG: U32 family peptidase [Planctomycetaceae bacterium]|nr:U32 family peptidase [Planctomycetaceae bacterium]
MQQHLPELLSPAGDEESLHAAVENGADAVYFGIAGLEKYNARVRAKNIPLEKLPAIMQTLHNRSMCGYVTLNTLVHDNELTEIEYLLRDIVTAGVDAIIVQDLGLAVLSKRFCPNLPIHASTQMSLTSQTSIKLAQSLGIVRVVLPRELSIAQIHDVRQSTNLQLESFIHGSLCISYSGQCYASLALGGRSANRGRCAQPCRIPYELIANNCTNNPAQILSPCDFAALPLLEKLVAAGVDSLKIEGRLKPPEYVAEVTRVYREILDFIGQNTTPSHKDSHANQKISDNIANSISQNLPRLEMIFSRGLSTAWLDIIEPRQLVPGNIMSQRGTEIGEVIEVRRDAAVVKLSGQIQRGDGVLFENTESPDNSQGGRVYEIIRKGESVQNCNEKIKVLLTFANNSINPQYIKQGQSVRKTDAPEIEREIRKSLESKKSRRRIPINIFITAIAGKPLKLNAATNHGAKCEIICNNNLEPAIKHPITLEILQKQFDRLGDTIYSLKNIDAKIEGNPMIPLSLLGKLRHELITNLENYSPQPKTKPEFDENLEKIKQKIHIEFDKISVTEIEKNNKQHEKHHTNIYLLIRNIDTLKNVQLLREIISIGCNTFYGEFCHWVEYQIAADILRQHNVEFVAVLPRIILPRENKILDKFFKLQPNAVLARNCEELTYFKERNIPVIADFPFNVINELSFQKLLEWGAERITPGFDLNQDQIEQFCKNLPASKIELIALGRIPLFTTGHCLWRANLIPEGQPCGQICKQTTLQIKDRRGAIHSVRPDILCRNIIENAAEYTIKPIKNIKHYRIEWDQRLGKIIDIVKKIKMELID